MSVQSLASASAGDVSAALFRAWPYHPRMLEVLADRWDLALEISRQLSLVWEEGGLLVRPSGSGFDISLGGNTFPSQVQEHLSSLAEQARRLGGRMRVLAWSGKDEESAGALPEGSEAREILSWERHPERGALHDPPRRWQEISVDRYWALREEWGRTHVAWPRDVAILRTLSEHLAVQAYMVTHDENIPAAAMLLWMPSASFVHVLDLAWHPDRTIRSSGRYLLQELYMHVPHAHVCLDLEEATSPLNRVLAALGYRVYVRRVQRVT